MKRRIAAVLVTATLLLGFAATPAYAAWSCITDTLCLFSPTLAGDPDRYVINNQSVGICFNIPAEWDNRMNWIRNSTNKRVTFYTGNVCNGALAPINIAPGADASFEGTDNIDEANSVRFQAP